MLFTENLHLAHRAYFSKQTDSETKIQKLTARQSYYCDKYIAHFSNFKRQIKTCSDIARIVYNFENNKIVSFQDIGDLPFAAHFEFETTTGDKILHD